MSPNELVSKLNPNWQQLKPGVAKRGNACDKSAVAQGDSMKRILAVAAAIAVLSTSPALARKKEEPSDPNMLTQGMVQMTLRVGTTTQAEIIETFGAPNITTMDASGQQMWVYDRHATVTSDSSGGFSIGILGGAGGGDGGALGGLGFGKRKSQSSTSTRSMTLVIKFDSRGIVSDFKSRSSSF